ncbi:MAG: response regulator transcription factor [Candidatus Bipolaricaulis sp.]|nr:response regulator transcription factor [Candidatus Bipolaricaulis sp.]
MAQRVLVVDDEKWVVDAVRRYLAEAGYEVAFAYDGAAALDEFARHNPDLVILDWLLPKLDGISVAEHIRRTSRAPIIMLTAKTGEEDRLQGFAAGVDDYVVKPFSARELEARVRAVLRRFAGDESPILQVGDVRLDREQRMAWVRGRPIDLSAMAFDLLAFLMTHPGRVFTRLELLEAVRGETYGSFERSVDSHIKRLRQRIEEDPADPKHVLTVFGIGYKMARGDESPPREDAASGESGA